MARSTVRSIAILVLALLGAPVALHVVLHDLHEHHGEHEAALGESGHGDHRHPIVPSPAPQLPAVTQVAPLDTILPVPTRAAWTGLATTERNVLSLGACRMDDDVGLQPLLSTFLI